jgi:hypothetical protein
VGIRAWAAPGRLWRDGWLLFDATVTAAAPATDCGSRGVILLRMRRLARMVHLGHHLVHLRTVIAAFELEIRPTRCPLGELLRSVAQVL